MKKLLLLILHLLCSGILYAQSPDCNKLYLHIKNTIYSYDQNLPVSATNPVYSGISLPPLSGGLAISDPLNGAGTGPLFYTSNNGQYYYYNGSTWINTGHISSSVNMAAGGGYIFNLEGSSGRVYRYDGTTEILLTTIPGGSAPYDLIADCEGNWYALNTAPAPVGFLRKYNAAGTLLQSWTINNPGGFFGSGGFGIIGNTIFFDCYFPYGIASGTIGATSVNINPNLAMLPAGLATSTDFATCAGAINLSTSITIYPDANDLCPGTPVTLTASIVNTLGTPAYQWKVNGVNAGPNAPTFTYIPANGDIVTCELTTPGACLKPIIAYSNPVTIVLTSTSIVPSVTVTNLSKGICIDSPVRLMASTLNSGTPIFQWYKNGILVGTNSPYYTDSSYVNGDKLYVSMRIPNGACIQNVVVFSDTITGVRSPLIVPGINVNSIPPNRLCDGTPVTLVTNIVGGGPTPAYKWYKNGALMTGIAGASYTEYNPGTGDTFMVELISSAGCPSKRITPSNHFGLEVFPWMTAAVSLTANPGTAIIPGTNVTFTAVPAGGGPVPAYQWYKNAVIIPGITGNTWTSNTLQTGDDISVRMESSEPCPVDPFAESNHLSMMVGGTGIAHTLRDNAVQLFPNPNNGQLFISMSAIVLSAGEQYTIAVLNAMGREVYVEQVPPNSFRLGRVTVTLPETISNGYYTVSVRGFDRQFAAPFVLKR